MYTLSPKDPDESEWFNADCTRDIQSGAGGTIASILWNGFEDGDGACSVVTGPSIDVTGLIISVKIAGGTAGVRYVWTVRYLTTTGETLEHSFAFQCAETFDQ